MQAGTIARPTNVRTSPPPLDAVWVGPAGGRASGVFSPVGLEAAGADGAASSMPAQAAARAVRRVGNILEGEDPVRGSGSIPSSAPRAGCLSTSTPQRPRPGQTGPRGGGASNTRPVA